MQKMKILSLAVPLLVLAGLASPPASAVSILWKAGNVDITLGLPASSLEFEDPTAVGKRVKEYTIIDWLDADYMKPGFPTYDEWTVSHPGQIDGNINEIWMRNAGQQIWTTTTKPSSTVSIHMTGDYNDGKAEVRVDGVVVAILDMGTPGLPQTALIVVKNIGWTTHNITVRDMGVGPVSRVGDDVHTFGAAALTVQPYGYKWWPHFWFLNARIRLYYTGGWIGVPTGFWWGWYPYYWYGYYWQPWWGPVSWYQPYCYYWYRPYWDYWPYYQYYRPWWHYWRWRGGWGFWGFNDYLWYRYWYWRPRVIYYWSWYWDPAGQGGCMELVTQADESNPAGGRILPFPDPCIPGFEAGTHEFSVNGGKATGSFSSLEFIPVSGLESYYRSITGVTDDDVAALMGSDIVQQLMSQGGGYVGVQHATWMHPEPAVLTSVTSDGLLAREGETAVIDVNLPHDPMGFVTVAAVSSDPDRLQIAGADPNGRYLMTFDSSNWQIPQYVSIYTMTNTIPEEDRKAAVIISREDDMTQGIAVEVTIQDNGCGAYGFRPSDLNQDCQTNFTDFAHFSAGWLMATTGD